MRIQEQWNDHKDLFGNVAEALFEKSKETGEFEVYPSEDQDDYGESGYITIVDGDGQKYSITLHKEC